MEAAAVTPKDMIIIIIVIIIIIAMYRTRRKRPPVVGRKGGRWQTLNGSFSPTARTERSIWALGTGDRQQQGWGFTLLNSTNDLATLSLQLPFLFSSYSTTAFLPVVQDINVAFSFSSHLHLRMRIQEQLMI